MGSDIARVSFDPSRRWRAVIAQQGRVTVEADWNEAQAIAAAQSRAQLLDVIGTSGTPDDGYRLLPPPSPPAAGSPTDLTIQHGTFYVGGARVELDADAPIGAQPDWRDFPAEPAAADQPAPSAPPQTGNELVYLLLREQEVSAVEDSALREIALGGPDTGQRTRILQRVLRHPTTADTWADGWADAGKSWAANGYALDPATLKLESAARLQVSFTSVTPPSACQPDALGGYLGAENQLIRVQICQVQNGNPVVVWGYDNASFLYRVTTATPDTTSGTTTLTLASTPVDTYHQPQPGQVVEVLTSAVQLPASPSASPTPPPPDAIASSSGVVAALTADGGYNPDNGTVVLGTALTAPFGTADTPVLFLRVWQGQATCTPGVPTVLGDTGLQVTLTTAAPPATPTATPPATPPATPTATPPATPTATAAAFHVGDHWLIAVRPAAPVQVYPARLLTPQPPDGPLLWATPLALVTWASGAATVADDARPAFGTLASLTRDNDYIAVSASDVDGGSGLQALVDSSASRPAATIRLLPGTYQLPSTLTIGPASIGLTIDGGGGAAQLVPGDNASAFAAGLILVNGSTEVVLRGLTLNLPLAPTTVPAAVISPLSGTPAQAVVQNAFGTPPQVSFGIQAVDAQDLTIDDCTFSYSAGTASLVAAGIFAGTGLRGLRVTGCQFLAAQPQALPFADLAAGNPTSGPYQVMTGFLQVPVAAPAGTSTTLLSPSASASASFTQPWLHDSRLADNLFEGLTVPVVSLSQLGTVFLTGNTVRASYGGFWLVSSADLASMYQAVLGPLGYNTSATLPTAIYGPLIDRIFVLVTAVGRSMTYQPPVPPAPNPSALARLGTVLGTQRVQTTMTELAVQHALRPEQAEQPPAGEAAEDAPVAHLENLGSVTATSVPGKTVTSISPTSLTSPIRFGNLNPVSVLPSLPILPISVTPVSPLPPPAPTDYTVRAAADVGTSLVLRLAISGNQIDAVIANSYSGAWPILVDQAATPGSALVSENRIRSRVPMGAAAWLANLVECVVTGNTIHNEAIASSQVTPLAFPYSILAVPIPAAPAGAVPTATTSLVVSGNVLVGGPMQALPRPAVAAPMNDWGVFNTIVTFTPPTSAPVPASSP